MVRVFAASDLHLLRDVKAALYGRRPARCWQQVQRQARRRPARLWLLAGDLVHKPHPRLYARLARALHAPALAVAGNHDAPRMVARAFGRPWRRLGAWVVLGLCSVDTRRDPGGRLPWRRLAHAARRLRKAKARHLLILMHHPPVRVGTPWMDAIGLADRAHVRVWLKSLRRVRAVVFGHAHERVDVRRFGMRFFGVPSALVQFRHGEEDFALDTLPPAWDELRLLANGRIVRKTHWVRDAA